MLLGTIRAVFMQCCIFLFDLTVLFTYLTPFRPWHIQQVNFTDPSGYLDSFLCKWIPKEVERFERGGR